MTKKLIIAPIKEYKGELLLVILAVFTVVIIFLRPHLSITNELPINYGTTGLRSDKGHSKNEGQSSAEYIDDSKMHFRCNIVRSKYMTPYCGLAIATSNSWTKGVDLSGYESIIFDIDYIGAAKTARFYLRNYNKVYSNKKNMSSTKYHIIEFETDLLSKPFEVKLSDFKVADWWIAKNKVPFSLSGNELTNVVIAQLQTGTKVPEGDHTFKINSIKMKKNIFSDSTFNIFLSAFWLFISFFMLILKVRIKNNELTSQKLKTNLLYQEKNILSVKANTDNLTQVLNRCGIEEHFLSIVSTHALSKGYFISAIFFDIDHFKSINDTKGHGVGDEVLSELSTLITKHIRTSDNFARWGGEEFIIICEQTMNKDAVIFAKKLCNIISTHKFSYKLTITASFGVYTERLTASSTLGALTDKADMALYKAKREGRNNVKNYNDFT